jgi:DNA polymerase-4
MGGILHVDLDAFFASIEQREHPEWQGLPVVVGGRPDQRGVVSTCSYEARRYGIHSAMPLVEAYQRCPQAIFVPGSHGLYWAVSTQIMQILSRYTPVMEQISVDEAFMDVSECERLFGDAVTIGHRIKDDIKAETQLTASVGVARNKLVAKIASDLKKPDGFVVVDDGKEAEFLAPLPVKRLWGIGPTTEGRLLQLGITTVGQLAGTPIAHLRPYFGDGAAGLVNMAQGKDDRPVIMGGPPKSVGHEHTFPQDTADRDKLRATLLELASMVGRRLRQAGFEGQTVVLKLRDSQFRTITRQRTLGNPTSADRVIFQMAEAIFNEVYHGERVRLIGVSLHQLLPMLRARQMDLFGQDDSRERKLLQAVDRLKDRMGEHVLSYGGMLTDEEDS